MYVDDFKMAGNAKEIGPMRKRLSTEIDLEPPVSLDGHVYLRCSQYDYPADAKFVQEKSELSQSLLASAEQ